MQSNVYPSQSNTNQATFDIAQAFYKIFRTFSKEDRFAITRYILADKDVQEKTTLSKIPNKTTTQAFAEDKQHMASFDSVDALREDILA